MKQTVIGGTGTIIRIDEQDDGVVLGCKLVYDEQLQDYIKDRKVAKYVSDGFKL